MKTHYNIIILLLIPVIVIVHTSLAVASMFASADAPKKVTTYQPEIMESEPIKIEGQSSGSGWWKWTLGILIIGGVAAAAGGGGGGGNSSSGSTTSTGTLVGTW